MSPNHHRCLPALNAAPHRETAAALVLHRTTGAGMFDGNIAPRTGCWIWISATDPGVSRFVGHTSELRRQPKAANKTARRRRNGILAVSHSACAEVLLISADGFNGSLLSNHPTDVKSQLLVLLVLRKDPENMPGCGRPRGRPRPQQHSNGFARGKARYRRYSVHCWRPGRGQAHSAGA